MPSSISNIDAALPTKLIPLHDVVLVRPIDSPSTIGNIILPASVQQAYPTQGVVLAIGSDLCDDKGEPRTLYQIGDTVMFSKYSGIEFKYNDGSRIFFMRDADLLTMAPQDATL